MVRAPREIPELREAIREAVARERPDALLFSSLTVLLTSQGEKFVGTSAWF